MSYCRWSDLDHACDLYCYYSDMGYETYVAALRPVGEVPKIKWTGNEREIRFSLSQQHEFLDNCERVPIGLPYDGQNFVDGDVESFEARLRELRRLGYVMPEAMFWPIWSEMAEEHVAELMSEEQLRAIVVEQYPELLADDVAFAKIQKIAETVAAVYADELEEVYRDRHVLKVKLEDIEAASANVAPGTVA